MPELSRFLHLRHPRLRHTGGPPACAGPAGAAPASVTPSRQTTRGLRALKNCNRGAAAVEFAIVSAVLLPMLFGIISFSTLLYSMSAMNSGAAEAARRVAVGAVTYAAANTTCSASMTAGSAELVGCKLMPAWGAYRINASVDCATKQVTVTVTNTSSMALGNVFLAVLPNLTNSTFTAAAYTRWEGSTCP